MLKIMRDSFQHLKWILVFIVGTFILFVFVDWGAGGAQGTAKDQMSFAAKVNGETVTIRDYQRALYYSEKRYEEMYGQPMNDQMRQLLQLPRQVMNGLVDQTLLLQQADKLHLAATDEEVRKKILQIPALSPGGKFVGTDLYQRYVTGSLGFSTVSDFERELAREVTLAKMEGTLESSVTIPPQFAEKQYRKMNESATVRFVLYPVDRVAALVNVSPAEVEAYYKANTGKYAHAEQRHVKYLLADLNQIRSRMNPSDEQLRAEYEKSKESFASKESVRAQHILIKVDPSATPQEDAAAKAKAEALVAQLRAGADFAALAKANSADPGSATRGGDVGFFERGQMVPEFEQKAFALKIGEISDPVKTRYGYHILKVNEKRPAGYKPFEEVRSQLASQVWDAKAKDEAREQIASVRARLEQAKPKDDQQVRNFTSATITLNDAQWFGKSDPVTGFGKLPQLTDWAFTAKEGDFGQIIDTPRGPIVPWLVGTRGAGVSPLDEIRPRVEADARQEKARAIAKQTLAQNMPVAGIDELAKKVSSSVDEVTLNRSGFVQKIAGNIDELVDAAMNAKVGEVKGPFMTAQGAIAFQVVDQKRFDPAQFAKDRDAFAQTLRMNEARKLRASLLERLRRDAKVEVNESLTRTDSGAQTPEG